MLLDQLNGYALPEGWGKLIEFGTGIYANEIRRTTEGGFILELNQPSLVKVNKLGQIEWQKVGLNHGIETADGGFAGIGHKDNRWFLTKFDSSQQMLWQRTYNFETSGSVNFLKLRAVASTGYILVGIEFNRTGPRKCLLLRTDSQGNALWLKRYPGFHFFDMEIVKNQSFILLGRPNVTVLKISASGDLLFKGVFGTGTEEPVSIQPTLDGNFVVASFRRSNPLNAFITKISISNTGKILWRQTFAGQPRLFFTSVRSTKEGLLVSGMRRAKNEPNTDMFIMQLDPNGILQWINYFGGTGSEIGNGIATTDNQFAIAGSTNSTPSTDEAVFLMKFPRRENAGNFCSFFKSYEEPITEFLVEPTPAIVTKTQPVENSAISTENSSFKISDGGLQFQELCELQ